MTSFGALAFVRTRVSRKVGVKRVKIGHAGTLDPLATGVLILCTGKKTKEIERLQLHDKDLTALCRTRLGGVRIEECITIDDFPQWLENQEIEINSNHQIKENR